MRYHPGVSYSQRGQLDISFNVQEARDRHVPVGMNILYDDRELYSDIPRVYPFDKPFY